MIRSSIKNLSTKALPTTASSLRGRFADLPADKLRGGYYTPDHLAAWMCNWAIKHADDLILEPSCGDGSFLQAAASRLKEIGAAPKDVVRQVRGVEIIATEANRARARLKAILGPEAESIIVNSDFFGWWQATLEPAFDAVIGNPPFIRYQSFPEPHRTTAMEIMGQQGLTPNRLTNIWVPFVVAATAILKPGGRLALVLPAEILQVSYAAQLRSYLADHFQRIDIVACNELFFENAEQEVVLLLADGALELGSALNICRVAVTETEKVVEITNRLPEAILNEAKPKIIRHDSEKWLKYFLDKRQIEFMRALRDSSVTTEMSTHASINVGVVTGKNEFFVLSSEQVSDLGVENYTTPLVSRSTQLKGARIGQSDWNSLSAAGDRVYLLNISSEQAVKLSPKLRQYIEQGEQKKFHEGFKCSIRKPWFTVPSVWKPDGFAFRQIYDFPRMVLNDTDATSTDTIHRLTSKGENPERVIANTYTWLTASSAEIEGRSYGGGVLELEPTEAGKLLMPAQLNGAMPLTEVDKLTRAGRLDAVLQENARIILKGHMGLSASDCSLLESIWIKMRDRRLSRKRGAKGTARISK